MTYPNTVAFSAGVVCCPDETSARRRRDRATWWDETPIERNYRDYVPFARPTVWLDDSGERRWTR